MKEEEIIKKIKRFNKISIEDLNIYLDEKNVTDIILEEILNNNFKINILKVMEVYKEIAKKAKGEEILLKLINYGLNNNIILEIINNSNITDKVIEKLFSSNNMYILRNNPYTVNMLIDKAKSEKTLKLILDKFTLNVSGIEKIASHPLATDEIHIILMEQLNRRTYLLLSDTLLNIIKYFKSEQVLIHAIELCKTLNVYEEIVKNPVSGNETFEKILDNLDKSGHDSTIVQNIINEILKKTTSDIVLSKIIQYTKEFEFLNKVVEHPNVTDEVFLKIINCYKNPYTRAGFYNINSKKRKNLKYYLVK